MSLACNSHACTLVAARSFRYIARIDISIALQYTSRVHSGVRGRRTARCIVPRAQAENKPSVPAPKVRGIALLLHGCHPPPHRA